MKMKPRHLLIWTAGILALLFLNLLRDLSFASKKYAWEPLDIKTLHKSISTTGVMEAIRVAEMRSEVNETVLKKMVQEGDAVKKNQPLVELSRTQTQLEFEQSKSSYLNAEAEYRKISRELEIQKKLLKNLAVSRSQVEETAQSKEKAKAALDISRRQLDIVQEKLNGTLVRSPIDGVVLKDFTKLGDKITAGKEIITVGDISQFIVRCKVDELDIQQVKIGQKVAISADAYPGVTIEGRVKSIATQAEREAFAKVEVIIEIISPDKISLKHNLSVRAHIWTEDIPNTLGVPGKSILRKKGDTAWVVIRNRLYFIREKKIVLGETAGEEVQVKSGLKPGWFVGVEKIGDAGL
jgi:RND family efflux transporter MFP subunit